MRRLSERKLRIDSQLGSRASNSSGVIGLGQSMKTDHFLSEIKSSKIIKTMCEICKKNPGHVRCDANFENEFQAEKVPEEIINFKPCGRLCCKSCIQTKIRDSPDRGVYLQAFGCKDCMSKVGPYLETSSTVCCSACILF